MLHTKVEGKQSRGRPRTRWIDQSRKDIEMRGKIWEKMQETGIGRIEMTHIVNSYL